MADERRASVTAGGAALVAAVVLAQGCASVGPHRGLFVSDAGQGGEVAAGCVRVTYLGTSAYLFEGAGGTVLVDPYFSRIDLATVALGGQMAPSVERIEAVLARLPARIDVIVATQGHFDHLMDAAEVAQRTGAYVLASPTACYLARAMGLPEEQAVPVQPGDVRTQGGVTVRVLEGRHDRLFGRVPFPGALDAVPERPEKASDWVLGTTLAFVIELGGQRIYVDSSGTTDLAPPEEAGPVDLAIVAVPLPDSRRRLPAALARLRPRYVLPNHQDDFFRPLDEGMRFGPMSDFAAVRQRVEEEDLPGKLILLDYFQPWTMATE